MEPGTPTVKLGALAELARSRSRIRHCLTLICFQSNDGGSSRKRPLPKTSWIAGIRLGGGFRRSSGSSARAAARMSSM